MDVWTFVVAFLCGIALGCCFAWAHRMTHLTRQIFGAVVVLNGLCLLFMLMVTEHPGYLRLLLADLGFLMSASIIDTVRNPRRIL